jgi:hypothetical protein
VISGHESTGVDGLDKAVGGVGYVEDHQNAAEFMLQDTGLGKFAVSVAKNAV